MITAHIPRVFSPSGRIAIVGIGAATPFGTAETTYQTRTGRFVQALPELTRLMGLTEVREGMYYQRKEIRAGRAVEASDAKRGRALSTPDLLEEFRDYVDRHVGIRVIQAEDSEEGFDPQRVERWELIGLKKDTEISGKLLKAGEEIRVRRYDALEVSHGALIPSGWDLEAELGFHDKSINKRFGRLHWIMARSLADAVISMGVPWSVVDQAVDPERRKVAASPGMAPGKFIREGMVNSTLDKKLEKWQLAQYLADNVAYYLARWINARHASSRVGACDTGICNMEDLFAWMQAGKILFGAVSTFEAAVNVASVEGFFAQKALATNSSVARLLDHPSLVSMPGLARRSGFTMGEGGGVMLWMDYSLAMRLGLIIYGEVLGASTALGKLNPGDPMDPAMPTTGVKLAFNNAINDWIKLDGITEKEAVAQIDLINGHGTSTPAGDINGAKCYDAIMEMHKRDPRRPVWVTYAKGGPRYDDHEDARQAGGNGTGHLLGGAATTAAVENLSVLEEGIIPGAVSSYEELDPEIANTQHLIYPTGPTPADIQVAVAEAEGFGDSNGVVITRKHDPDRMQMGRQMAGRQQEARAWRDEQFSRVRGGSAKAAEYLPPLRKES